MKFQDIKVGDEVFVGNSIRYGWNLGEEFFIPEKVVRVTKTQFSTVSGRRFKKEYGQQIGSGTYGANAYMEGDKKSHWSDDVIYDQTKEMEEFKKKISLERDVIQTLADINPSLNSGLSLKELAEIKKSLLEIKARLNPTP
jgi:ribosomal protein S24E